MKNKNQQKQQSEMKYKLYKQTNRHTKQNYQCNRTQPQGLINKICQQKERYLKKSKCSHLNRRNSVYQIQSTLQNLHFLMKILECNHKEINTLFYSDTTWRFNPCTHNELKQLLIYTTKYTCEIFYYYTFKLEYSENILYSGNRNFISYQRMKDDMDTFLRIMILWDIFE